MKLEKIKVEGLYGTFNHEITFKKEERITILIGQNGLGKTIILRMLKCFFDQDFIELKSLYFHTFTLFFNGNSHVFIERRLNKDKDLELSIEYTKAGKKVDKPFIPKDITNRRRYRPHDYREYQIDLFYNEEYALNHELDFIVEKFIPEPMRKLGPGLWLDPRRRREYTTYELIDKYKDYFPPEIINKVSYPSWLKEITEGIKVRIVEAQRLLNRIKAEDGKYKSAVVEYSQEIIERIKAQRAAASDLASRLDRTYPKRLLERIQMQDDVTSKQITESLEALEKKRKILNEVGLVETEEQYMQPYIQFYEDKIIKNVLLQYINDSNAKLKIYDDLEKRISLFLNIINKRFLYKQFFIDKQNGFKFKSLVNGNDIPLIGLSSGEQHELVLFYQLLFSATSNSLLLIDEPEISLHISWQKQFIDDLKKVISINELDILIATHSPDIIGNYWDLAIQLEGQKLN